MLQLIGQTYHGGVPPNLDDVKSENTKIDNFVELWLGRHKHISHKIKRFIVANMLRHWEETIEIIQKEPRGLYRGEKYLTHPYIMKVKNICMRLQLSNETFNSWVKDTRNAFILNNSFSMSHSILNEAGVEKYDIDGRSFDDKINAILTQ